MSEPRLPVEDDVFLPYGVWPVMLTPFNADGGVDEDSCERLVEWYLAGGCSGLFANCLSSEMYDLSLEEQMKLIRFVQRRVAGRVPVVASVAPGRGELSGSASLRQYVDTIRELVDADLAAVVVLTNQLANADESDDALMQNGEALLTRLDPQLHLGLYECPDPYKRIVNPEVLSWARKTGRFYFLKDTCCSSVQIRAKLESLAGSHFRLYNAHTGTLLGSLRDGAYGYSGVGANYVPHLYAWLCHHFEDSPQLAEELSGFLTRLNMLIGVRYPAGIKEYLKGSGLIGTSRCRVSVKNEPDIEGLTYGGIQSEILKWEERLALPSPLSVI
ncbi:MAG: dihydrodipicolinate synthase family protein [Verrucomicrobiota bacterium JB024]|nr:dihydrodipicolinate synthase family protein [Verrucomicrobiota bacterium JB024]